MSDCEHKEIIKRKESQKAFGETFEWQADVCSKCNAVMWDGEVQSQYDTWLADVYRRDRDKFSVQFSLPEGASDCLVAMARRYPSIDEASLMRALISVYLLVVPGQSAISDAIEKMLSSETFFKISSGLRVSKKVRFKPKGLIALQGMAELLETPPAKFAEEILLRMLNMAVNSDVELKQLWEEMFASKLEAVLNAA